MPQRERDPAAALWTEAKRKHRAIERRLWCLGGVKAGAEGRRIRGRTADNKVADERERLPPKPLVTLPVPEDLRVHFGMP